MALLAPRRRALTARAAAVIMSDPICVQAIAPSSTDQHDTLPQKVDLDSTAKFPTWMLVITYVPH